PQSFTRQHKTPPASLKERSMADDRTIRGAGDRSRINMTMTAARTHTSVSPPNPKHARAAPRIRGHALRQAMAMVNRSGLPQFAPHRTP
ncbi:MAG: hypothetical protein WBQ20_17465, partial [Methyloceanibacter sp.]